MDRTINVSYETEDQFVELYLSLFYKQSKLTPQEYELLVEIVKNYSELKDKVPEPYLTELIFSTDRRKAIQEKLNISDSGFSNLVKGLKGKGVFGPDQNVLLPFFYPTSSVRFSFTQKRLEKEKPLLYTDKEILEEEKIEDIEVVKPVAEKTVGPHILEAEDEEEKEIEKLQQDQKDFVEEDDPVTFDGTNFNSDNFVKTEVKVN